jgi:ATP-dependent protease Clp ATPase subunit
MKSQEHNVCSFCGQHESETLRIFLVPGKLTAICEECVTFSKKILSEQSHARRMEGSCSFCGKTSSQVERLVYGPGTNICKNCIDFAQQQLGGNAPTVMNPLSCPWRGMVVRLKKLLRTVLGSKCSPKTL